MHPVAIGINNKNIIYILTLNTTLTKIKLITFYIGNANVSKTS